MLSWFRKKKTPVQPDSAADATSDGLLDAAQERARRAMADGRVDELPLDIETIPFPENEPEGVLAESARVLAHDKPAAAPADHLPTQGAQAPALAFYAGTLDAAASAGMADTPVLAGRPDTPAHAGTPDALAPVGMPGTAAPAGMPEMPAPAGRPDAPTPLAERAAAGPARPDIVRDALEGAGLPGEARTEALAVWSSVLERHEGAAAEDAWKAVLPELRRRRLRAPALAVTQALAAANPDALWPLAELARLQGAGADHAGRLALGQRLCARFPESPEGPPLVVQGLLGLDRRAEAERFYDGLPESFPDQDWYLTTGIRLARARDDTARVVALAGRLRALAPDRPLAYTAPAAALRQAGRHAAAEALAAEGVAACPGSAEIWREAALTAQAMGNAPLAFQRWAGLRANAPNLPAGYAGAIQLAERLRQPEAVRGLLEDGLRAFPDDRDLLMAKARASAEAGDWDDATARWSTLIARAPADPAIRVAAVAALAGPAEGRAARLPGLLALLEETSALFPDHVPAGIAHMRVLREAGRPDQARAVGDALGARFPDHQGVATARSRIAALDGQPDQALAILEAARAASPRTGLLEAAYASALSAAGRLDEADQVCSQALAGLPGDVGLLAERTRIAMRREDWTQALGRAEQAVQARPEDATLRAMLARVSARSALVEDE